MRNQGLVEWVIQWETSSCPPTLQAARDNCTGYHLARSTALVETHKTAASQGFKFPRQFFAGRERLVGYVINWSSNQKPSIRVNRDRGYGKYVYTSLQFFILTIDYIFWRFSSCDEDSHLFNVLAIQLQLRFAVTHSNTKRKALSGKSCTDAVKSNVWFHMSVDIFRTPVVTPIFSRSKMPVHPSHEGDYRYSPLPEMCGSDSNK